jgi:hypothetical protein
LEIVFPIGIGSEVFFDGFFTMAVNDADLGDTGSNSLFDEILNIGLVDDRNKLLGIGFDGREETGTATGGGNDSLGDFDLGHSSYMISN